MELRQLEYIVAVADHGTFTRAAASVHVSQPSLSHGVRTLETELGIELFVRLSRSAVVTDAGHRVIEAARRVLRDMADLAAISASVSDLASGTLELVALPTLAVDPLAALVGQFRLRHPGVTVRIHESEDPAGVETSVRAGTSELGITDVTTGGHGLTRVRLFRQEVLVVSPPGHDAGDAITPGALAQLPLIATPLGTSTRRLLDHVLGRTGQRPNIVVETNHREAIVPLVLAGAGSSLLPASTAEQARARGAVVRSVRPPVSRTIGILHRPDHLSPAARAMLDLATGAVPTRR